MAKYIDRDLLQETFSKEYCRFVELESSQQYGFAEAIWVERTLPDADVVPWSFLERYADYFCASVSMPEFIREAKAFYADTNKAMDGGNISDAEGTPHD